MPRQTSNQALMLLVGVAAVVLSFMAPGSRPGAVPARRIGGSRHLRGAGDEPFLSSGAAGRGADSPTEIPARGWWAILKRVARQVSEHRLMTEAAGITFYALLSLFPALAAMISLYGLVADPSTVSDTLSGAAGVMPGGGMDILREQLHSLTAADNRSLGFAALFGLVASLWSANQGVKALFDSLNVVYGEREKRSFIRRTALSLGFTLAAIVFVMLATAAIVVLPVVLAFVGLGGTADLLLRLARWPLLLVVVAIFLAALYRIGPSREHARWRWVSWGGAFAAVTWLLGSAAFSWYVANFGSYNKTYGSLGAVVGFMTWIWLSGIVVLTGAELNAEMEHQTARDTTTGPERPLGRRGALKADTVVRAE